jgi:hypothetical protein
MEYTMKSLNILIALVLTTSSLCTSIFAQNDSSLSPEQDFIRAISESVSGFESHKRSGQNVDDFAYKNHFVRSMTDALSTYYYNLAVRDVATDNSISNTQAFDAAPILTTFIVLQDILEARPAAPNEFDSDWAAKFSHALELHLLQVRALLYNIGPSAPGFEQPASIERKYEYVPRAEQHSDAQAKAQKLRSQVGRKVRRQAKAEVSKADQAWGKAQYERAAYYYAEAIRESSSTIQRVGARPKF